MGTQKASTNKSIKKVLKKRQHGDSKSVNQQIYQKRTQKTSTWGLKKCQRTRLTLFDSPRSNFLSSRAGLIIEL